MRRIASLLAVAFVVTCSVSDRVAADGCYIPEKAHPKPPSIPRQRALVIHREGLERLIIESSLDAEGQTFGWIIPVPASPRDLSKVTPGVLDTLESMTEGRITHDVGGSPWVALIVAGVSFLVFGAIVRWWEPGDALVIVVCGLLFAFLLLPSLGTAGHRGVSPSDQLREGIRTAGFAQIGSYEVAVLEATRVDALDDWLQKNGLTGLPQAGRSIAEAYIREKWSFVVARLRREGTGLCSPHPLSMTFSAETAVYPMRLTSLSASPVALDLYCLADYKASVAGLHLGFCDTFAGPVARGVDDGSTHKERRYQSRSFEYVVGLPSLVRMLWDGCVLTRLSATVSPDGMRADYRIDTEKPTAYERHRYSYKGALMTGVCWSLIGWGPLLIVAGIVARRKHGIEMVSQHSLERVVLPASLIALLAVGLIYLGLPKVAVVVKSRGKGGFIGAGRVITLIRYTEASMPHSISHVQEHCRQLLLDEHHMTNPYSGAPIREQESPGDYQIIEDKRGIVFRLYGRYGWPHDMVLCPPIPAQLQTSMPGR